MEPYGALFGVLGAFFKPKRGQACPFGAGELLISPKGAWQAPFGLDVGSGGLRRPFLVQKGPDGPLLAQKKALGGSGGLFLGKKGPRRPLFAQKKHTQGLLLVQKGPEGPLLDQQKASSDPQAPHPAQQV